MAPDWQLYLEVIENSLRRILVAPEDALAPLYGMISYHMGWLDEEFRQAEGPRGKRVRPILCLLACQAVSGGWEPALPAACAIELIHAFSLLHDDIEDSSEMRHHRATVWSLWGVPQALNAGDATWAISRLVMDDLLNKGHDPSLVLKAIKRLDEACLELCLGQYLDLSFEAAESVTLAAYERMVSGKTAALLSAAPAVGALLGGANEGVVAEFASFGHELGLGFQIVDDILGIWGEEGITGKSAATDILSRKKTFPIVYTQEWEADHGLDDLATLYRKPFLDKGHVAQVLTLLERAGARRFSHEEVDRHLGAAFEHLAATGLDGDSLVDLITFGRQLLSRSF